MRQLYYPVADRVPLAQQKEMDVKTLYLPSVGITSKQVMAKPTGEKRPPRKGEWFLSGALVEAYYAPNDLSTSYYIAKLVRVKRVTILVED